MSDRIQTIEVRLGRWSSAEAELWIVVRLAMEAPGAEVRGVLHGPRCEHTRTIEIAHPIVPVPAVMGAPPLTGRVIVPEPCAWEAAFPYRYEGTLELWADGTRLASRPLRYEFRPAANG